MAYTPRHRRLIRCLTFEESEARLCLSCPPFSMFPTDLDGDGDTDVVYKDCEGIAWLENIDGTRSLGNRQAITSEWPGTVDIADMDADGDVDVLVSLRWQIAWYENTNGQERFVERQVARQTWGEVHAADLDSDGDMDVLWSSAPSPQSTIAWYENTDGQGSFGPQQVITTEPDVAIVSVHAADLDGDGDMDVLSLFDGGNVVWYENTDGEGTFGRPQVIVDVAGSRSIDLSDVDGDGDADILSASYRWDNDKREFVDNRIVWYENTDGRGSFGEQDLITSEAGGGPLSFHAADLDGDGDVDVLSASSSDRNIAWYENTDGKGSFGEQQIITKQAFCLQIWGCVVSSADMDGDGDLDALALGGYGILEWYENLSPEFDAGDANRDLQFDEEDTIFVLQAAKYLTGEPATWEEGDWNGDGVFDQEDIVTALQTANYLQGPYAADALFATIGG